MFFWSLVHKGGFSNEGSPPLSPEVRVRFEWSVTPPSLSYLSSVLVTRLLTGGGPSLILSTLTVPVDEVTDNSSSLFTGSKVKHFYLKHPLSESESIKWKEHPI